MNFEPAVFSRMGVTVWEAGQNAATSSHSPLSSAIPSSHSEISQMRQIKQSPPCMVIEKSWLGQVNSSKGNWGGCSAGSHGCTSQMAPRSLSLWTSGSRSLPFHGKRTNPGRRESLGSRKIRESSLLSWAVPV